VKIPYNLDITGPVIFFNIVIFPVIGESGCVPDDSGDRMGLVLIEDSIQRT